MRTVGGADLLIEGEGLEVRREPARARRGVLRQEADQLGRGPFGSEVARAPVPEPPWADLDQLDARRLGDLAGAVARARVDHEGLIDALERERIEQLLQVALAVLDGYDHR